MCYPTDTKPVQADKPVVPSFEHVDYKTANSDQSSAWEFIEELRIALAHFGITVSNDPAFDDSGETIAVVISRDDINTEDLAKTLKADMPEMYQGIRTRTIASKLRTPPLFSKGDEVGDTHHSNEISIVVRREWAENHWHYEIRHKKDTNDSFNYRSRYEHELKWVD